MNDVATGWRGERRERLLDAASRVFARTGYEQASMDEIAAEAGVGKPTLYRYFDSKSALFTAVFVDALDRLEAKLDKVLRQEEDVEGRLRGMVLALIPTFRDHLVSLRMLSENAAAIDQSKRRIFRERRARLAGCLAAALDHPGVTLDPLRAAHLIVGMIWSGTAGLGGPDEEIASTITHLVLHGITAREAASPGRDGDPLPSESAARRRNESANAA